MCYAFGEGGLIVRNRLTYLTLALGTMTLGLVSRSNSLVLPEFIVLYAGDTLWALLVFWLVRVLNPSSPIVQSALLTLGFAFLIEGLQLYHAPWIDGIRATTLGGLVLGYGFLLSDLICYSVGVFLGYALNILIDMKRVRG